MIRCLNVSLVFVLVSLLGCGEKQNGSPPQSKGVVREAEGENQVAWADKKPAKEDGAPAGKPPVAPAANKPTPRKIIYTGTVDLVVDDFDKAEQQLRQLVEEHGGYLDNSDIHNQPGSPRSGSWTVRVPTKEFAPFVRQVAAFGEVRNRSTNSQDITDAYHDKAARLKADETEEKSLLGLLEKTQGKVEDILRVREQLRIVRGQIEENKSRLQRWDKDVDLATVTVKLLDRRDYTPPLLPDFGSTVGRAFSDSIDALVLFGKAIVLTVVTLGPWLPVLAVIATPGFVIWRRRRAARMQTAVIVSDRPEETPTV